MPLAPGQEDRYVVVMLGRVLFAVVWLIIAAGLVLPLYPSDRAAPGLAVAGGTLMVADTAAPGCEDCAAADLAAAGCRGSCACWQVLPAASAARVACLSLTVYLITRPLPAGQASGPQPLPPKPPAI
jgi:hypothetical protein